MASAEQNLSATERAVYMAVGLGLAAAAAQPRPNPLLNVLALAGGSYLAWSGYQGHCVRSAQRLEIRFISPQVMRPPGSEPCTNRPATPSPFIMGF